MKHNDRYTLAALLSTLAVALVALVILELALYSDASPDRREPMRLELFKSGLQLAVIVIVGGGIALLYKWVERNWETRRTQSELRKHYVARLGDAYRGVKEARRLLRASGIRPLPGAAPSILSEGQIDRYDEQMRTISQEQLALEALGIESENFPLAADSKSLTSEIRKMERYLGRIIDEYEDVRPQSRLDLGHMKRLSEFTGEPDEHRDARVGTFQENFVKPHYRAIKLVAR